MTFMRSKLLFICGLLVMAAVPVFAQEEKAAPAPSADHTTVKEIGKAVQEKVLEGEIDLSSPFAIEIELVVQKGGKASTSKLNILKAEGDEKLVELVRSTVDAVNEGGHLSYLDILGGKSFKIAISQDDSALSAGATAEVESATRAKNLMIMVRNAVEAGKNTASEMDRGLLNGITAEVQGKVLSIKLHLPKSLIEARLKALIAATPE